MSPNSQVPSAHHQCPVCRSTDVLLVNDIPSIPVFCNVLFANKDDALAVPTGEVRLRCCHACGHIFNTSFDPSRISYAQQYENSLHFSPRFREYSRSLAAGLIVRYDLREKSVVEIGCGDGHFLRQICELGNNQGVGFDPALPADASSDLTLPDRVTIVRDYYSDKHAEYEADLICCRHTLEHIQEPRELLSTVRKAATKSINSIVVFEVPNVMYTVRDLGIWDIIYEHCSYFSRYSLARLFAECGFQILDLRESYGGQFLVIEAVVRDDADWTEGEFESAPPEYFDNLGHFATLYRDKIADTVAAVNRIREANQKAVVWGAGSKGVTFLNTLHRQAPIDFVVDINPRKRGMFVPGTGQEIIAPEYLTRYKPDVVIVMNPMYTDEIRNILEDLSVDARIMAA